MKRQTKFTSGQQAEEQQQHRAAEQETEKRTSLEFATPEELLRHDALHTPVPPTVAHRLRESISQTPASPRSWWRRLLGW